MPADQDAVAAAVTRPSRQDLVVPPRASSWPVAAGAVASAAAGFALVLFLGIGRSRPGDEAPAPAADEVAIEAPLAEPQRLPAAEPPDALPADRWAARGDLDKPVADVAGDRYATRPVSHDASALGELASEKPPRSLSRFSSPDLPPAVESPGAADEPGSVGLPADPALEPGNEPTPPPPDAEPISPAAPAVEPPDADDASAAEPSTESAPAGDVPAAEAQPAAVEPQPAADVAGEPRAPQPAADALPAEPANPIPPAEPVPPAAASNTSPAPPGLVSPDAPTPLDAPAPRDGAAFPPPAAPAAPLSVAGAPPADAIPAGLPPAPFAAAPAIGPPPPAQPPAPAAPRATAAAAEPAIEGQGVPGPLQLEGVQTPQLTVEKRGPKEIQVGQPARFEILVRNVGSATAHDVTLRDEVPRGTSLIATTPPAAPAAGEATAELIWLLGTLPPAGEARVLMELMPEAEGEVGSVASVSFRADATLRTRATKPALVIDCPPPKPVRIGGDLPVSLTVSNPGSGTATGVVLEAFLPETVSHRAGPELEFDVGQLRPGESKTIDLVLGTRTPGQAPARFVARADGGIEIDRPLPLPVTAPTLELAIDMPARRFLQRPATCSISMVNAGTASARGVELAAQLPSGMKFVRANHAGWHDERTHRVLWNLEELPAGETGTVEVVVMPIQPGGQRITAAARSNDGPSDQAIHVCQVEGLAALAFHVADSEDPIEVEGVTEYVIRVANEGTKSASGVRLAATLLGDLEPVEAEGPGRHRIENLAIEFEPLAKLGPGEEAVYKIRARGQRAGHQRVQVQLVSDDQPTPITKEEVTSVYDDR